MNGNPKMSDRDYKDLSDPNLIVYNFRGYTVIKYNKSRKELEFGENANLCSFIKEDLLLMSDFLRNLYNDANNTENVSVD